MISSLAFRGSACWAGWGKVRQASVLHGLVRSVFKAFQGLGLHGTSRSGPVSSAKVRSGDTRRGEVSYGLARQRPVRLGWVWQAISCCPLALQGPVRFAALRYAISRSGVVVQASVARGAVACATVWLGLSRRGTVGSGEVCPGDPRLGRVWRGLSWLGLVRPGPARFSRVGRDLSRLGPARMGQLGFGSSRSGLSWHGRVSLALVRRGVARLGLLRLGQSRPGPVRLGRAGSFVARLAKARSCWPRLGLARSFLACWGLAAFASLRLDMVWSGLSGLANVRQRSVGRRQVRSFVLSLVKVMWAVVRFGRVWCFRVRSAVGLAWPVDVRCALAGFGKSRFGDVFHGLPGLRVARYSNARSSEARYGRVCLGLSRRALVSCVRARLPEAW